MSKCNLDHSLEDVKRKLEEQWGFLPESLAEEFHFFLSEDLSQDTLNEAFHLLKKYDLVTNEEKLERNKKIKELFSTI